MSFYLSEEMEAQRLSKVPKVAHNLFVTVRPSSVCKAHTLWLYEHEYQRQHQSEAPTARST